MSAFRVPARLHALANVGAWSFFAIALACQASAQPFQVGDINARTSDRRAIARDFVAFGGETYFVALDTLHGKELWRTDGSPGGTHLVRDLCPGPCDSVISRLARFGDHFYFVADDGFDVGLYRSDGSTSGTGLVARLTRTSSGNEARLFDLGDLLLIARGTQLWRTDGTEAGTFSLPNPGSSVWNDVAVLGGTAFFVAGGQLWRTEGSEESTVVVAPELSGLGPRQLTVFAGRLYFAGGPSGRELWRSDGTSAGTFAVAPGTDHADPEYLTAADSRLYFFARSGQGDSLWRTDGTEQGTVLIALSSPARETAAIGDRLYYRRDTEQFAAELWTSDGTEAGTRLVSDISPGPAPSDPRAFTPFGELLVFTAAGRLWRTDGSDAGTQLLGAEGVAGGIRSIVAAGDHVYFSVDDNATGDVLWRTDATPAGTAAIKALDVVGSSDPSLITALGPAVIFGADDGLFGEEPWRSDGSRAGTFRLEDVRFGPDGPPPSQLTPVGDTVFFGTGRLIPATYSRELWRTDGSVAGTTFLRSFRNLPTVELSALRGFFAVGDLLYFAASDDEGAELWRSDGSEAGTFRVKNILEGSFLLNGEIENPKSSDPLPRAALGSILYLKARDESGVELWRSDGTEAGTRMVKDIFPGPQGSSPEQFTKLDGRIYFTAGDAEGRALWRTDGTEAGTEPLIRTTANITDVVVAGNRLFWLAAEPGGSPRLWRLDGTTATKVSDLELDGPSEEAGDLFAVGERLYFVVDHPATGQELWTSDGSPGGTGLLKEIQPGFEGAAPQSFFAVDDRLLFAAARFETGLEMWISDGTEAGTVPLPEISPGATSSSPSGFTLAGDLIYFSAADQESGRELWAIERQALGGFLPGGSETALYLNQERFEVEVTWNTGTSEGVGQGVELTEDSGYFWFFIDTNVELVVKVLDACNGFDRFWVFIAGLTNVEVKVTVRDRRTGEVRSYQNPLGRALLPVQDTDAFATCGG